MANRKIDRYGDEVIPDLLNVAIDANVHIYQGALVVSKAGYANPGSAAPGLMALGIALEEVDNTGGAQGALNVPIRQGVFKFDNSAAGEALTAADVGKDCYLVDDHTVGKTDGGNGAKSRAGKVIQVDADGVFVEVGIFSKDADVKIVPLGNIDLASIAGAGQVVGGLTMPYGGTIKGIYATVGKPATTAAKRADLQPRITPAGGAAAAVTGGVASLTSAACTPLGAQVQGSAITAGNTFKAGDTIDVQALAPNFAQFVEGNVSLFLVVGP